jgi:hypothetical protein
MHVLILTSLVVSGCGPASTAAPQVPTEPPLTEAQTEEPQPGGSTPAIILVLMYPGAPDTAEGLFISGLVEEFRGQYPDIGVDLQFVPGSSYRETLLTQAAAGALPDLAKIDYVALSQLYPGDFLLPMEEAGEIDPDFLDDALNSTLFEGFHYGLPQWRDSCSLAYEYFSILSDTQYPQEAFLLADYLSEVDQQVQAFEALAWYPTRESLYGEGEGQLGIECLLNESIRITPEQSQLIVDLVRERAPALDQILAELEGGTVMPEQSTGVFENGDEEPVGFGAAVWNPLSREEAEAKMASTGLVMGVLFINEIPEYPPGDYVVRCYTESCELVDASGNSIPYDLLIEDEFETAVQVPRIALVPGSTIVCKWYLFWLRCTRVG